MTEMKIDFFGDGMRIFLDYISRQIKKNPDYDPHPLVKAFELAMTGALKVKKQEHTMGLSGHYKGEKMFNPYIVVIEKKKKGFEVKEIRDIANDKELPLDLMVMIFRLQILLDKIEGETVIPKQMEEVLNEVIPEKPFYAMGERWKEARENFRQLLKDGKMHLPNDPELIKELTDLKYETPWEDYSPRMRSLIGTGIRDNLDDNKKVFITSPSHWNIQKFKAFEALSEYFLGKSAKYLRPKDESN